MPERELSFVHFSGRPDDGAKASNKVVRAHVMRRYKREQRAKIQKQLSEEVETDLLSHQNASPTPSNPPRAGSDPGSYNTHDPPDGLGVVDGCCTADSDALGALQLWYSDMTASPLSPVTWLDGYLDPFASLPVRSTPRALMLLQQNATSFIRTSVHADPDNLYRQSCSSNPAWLFMNMFYASSRFPAALDDHLSEKASYLLQSISAVGETIARSPDLVSDSILATVACLANIENLNGGISDAAVHMSGLVRMVEMRGGLGNLGMRGILRRMVSWSDLLTSSRLARAPRFRFYTVDKSSHLSDFTPTVPRHDYLLHTNHNLADITTAEHHVAIPQLLVSLHGLSTFLNAVGTGELPWDAAYPDRLYDVEYRILVSLFDDQIVADSLEHILIRKLLLHSALIFIYTNLRETPVGGVIRNRLLVRLKDALYDADLSSLFESFTAEMLWIFVIGAAAANGADQIYFLQKTRQICMVNHIRTWPELRALLKSVPALERSFADRCVDLWTGTQLLASDNGSTLYGDE